MTTTIALTEAIAARTAAHNESTSLLSVIESSQNTIVAMQSKLNGLNTAVSYYRPVADVYTAEIEKQTAIRNEAICKYESMMWKLYSASLPVFSNTSTNEVAVTLYSAHSAQA